MPNLASESESISQFDELVAQAAALFANCHKVADLENAKSVFLGKDGVLSLKMRELAKLPADEKKSAGASINQAKQQVEAALFARREALTKLQLQARLAAEALDITLPGRAQHRGGLHPITSAQERIELFFAGLGFTVATGPEIEADWFNFTALNMPPDHPARSMHDTFYIADEAGTTAAKAPLLLRTHTSPMQIRYAQRHVAHHQARCAAAGIAFSMPDLRVIAPGRTYRVDSDATHSPMFHQCEGLWIGQRVSFSDLKSVFTLFCQTFFENDALELRFRPSFFPFTEPSAEIDIQFPSGPLAGKWLEVAGSGQVHPNVVQNMGLDSEQYMGFAFGMGIDRFAMLQRGISDLRLFFDGDLRFLSQFH